MPWIAVGLSIMATLMSTISYLGMPGEMIKNGVTLAFAYLAIPLNMLVIFWLWVPFFMRLRMTSAYEYLENRFDYRARLLGGLLFLCLRMGWMSMVMYTASMALEQVLGINALLSEATAWELNWMIALVGIAATLYTCLGGIRAVIWTDVLQSLMLFGGAAITLLYVMWHTQSGPLDWWDKVSLLGTSHTRPQ